MRVPRRKKTANTRPERAPGAAPPANVEPQLATLVTTVPEGDDWIHEIKFDGYRLLCRVAHRDVRLLTRGGQDWTTRFPAIAAAAAGLSCDNALIDLEAVVLNERGISDFQALQNAIHHGTAEPVGFAFDLLFLDGRDLRREPLLERKRRLKTLLGDDARLRYTDHVQGRGPAFHAQACQSGLEGIISKRAGAPYRSGRGRDWLKIKCVQRQEFVIVGYTDPAGSRKGLGALLLGVHEDGELVYAGKVGTGFSEATLRQLHTRLSKAERRSPALAQRPAGLGRGVHWVEPKLVAEVAFTEWTRDGRIRHPSFQGLREDKAAADIVRERPANAAQLRASGKREAKARARSVRNASGRGAAIRVAGIRLTNPDRVLFPEQGVTKLDLARYWERVAERALPYLLDRPLTLLRCPTGRSGQCFYQKHASRGMPAQVPRVTIEERDGPAPYLYIDGLPAVIALVQFGVLELHVWNARRDNIQRPDQLVFDLDPGEGVPWTDVVHAARALREQLASLELTSYVKWSGGKGLHVVAPLMRRSGWDEVREFARALAERMAKAEPARYTAVMSKSKRTGRIFIDYLRNGYNATAIAPYSPRARPDAPVSLPFAWDRLPEHERPALTIGDVPARLGREDPWHGFGDVRQSITARMRKAVGLR